jgi:hypothetical protein
MKTQNGIPESSSSSVSALPDTNPVGLGQVPVLHSERAHSKISPSKLSALEKCAGFMADESAEVHPITLRGTAMHEAVESGDDSKLSEEERGWVKMCRDFRSGFIPPNATCHREIRLDVLGDIWGFADEVAVFGSAAYLLDWKFGISAQAPVEENPAAQAYVLGIFQKWPTVDHVHVAYCYPRRDEVDTCHYHRKDVPMIRLRIETIAARVENFAGWDAVEPVGLNGERGKALAKASLANPIPDNCRYCGRKATCQALHRMVLPIATRYAERKELEVPKGDFSLVKSPEQFARLLDYAPVLEAMADSIKRHALEFREQTGQEIPGYEMRSRKGKSKIVNADVAYKVANEFGVTHEQFMACVDVSAAQLRKAVEENAPKGQKSKFAAALDGELRDAGVLEVGAEGYFLGRVRG